MTTLSLRTPSGTETDPTPERIAAALRATDRALDGETFAVVERDDGVFVQLAPEGALEAGGTGPLPHRLDHAELALRMVERLRRRQDPWGDLPHWDLMSQEPVRAGTRKRSRLYGMLAVLAFVLFLAAFWFFLGRT